MSKPFGVRRPAWPTTSRLAPTALRGIGVVTVVRRVLTRIPPRPSRLYGEGMRWTTVTVGAAWVAALVVTTAWLVAPGSKPLLVPFVAQVIVGLVPLALAIPLARRLPGHPASALLAAAGLGAIVSSAPVDTMTSPSAGSWMLLYLSFAILLLVVPDGRTASRRWATVGWVLCSVVAAFIAVVAVQALVPALLAPTTPVALALLPIFLALLVACAAAPIVRYRRSDERARLQLRWIYVTGASLPVTLLLCWASYLVFGTPDLVAIGLVLMYTAIPAGVTMSLLHPDAVDIDRAAVATVTATVLSVAALGVLSVASAVVGLALVDWSPVAAIATAVGLTLAAVLSYPFVRRGADHVLYPERGRAVTGLRRLSVRVDAGAAEPEEVENALQTALRDEGLRIGYRRLSDAALVGLDGRPIAVRETTASVRVRGDEIGAIVPSAGRVKRPAGAIATAAAPLLDAIRMRAELSLAMSEVAASRSRILKAGYDERRRLERDLHDGAQQRLVALGMRLRVLQRTSSADDHLSETLDTAVAELGTAVAELRQIAHGVRPSALDDGLGPALAGLTRLAPDTIELDVQDADLPDAVTTTAYFVASEAVANALRHAEASRIRIDVTMDAAALHLAVADDGRGGARLRTTGGLTGLVDRVEALGGSLTVDSAPGRGTRVEAVLPCGS
ncbi:sensor histidine kinase [Microbacterium aoyamense]|nr:sensor histidine kinase [Microbacterium aoyamense]